MAITQTGAMYKSLSFDNTSSRSYGVYITGEAVYNAPERAVEMISIPGRNGAFALDQGRFENIEVSYPAGIFAENEADFAQAVSDFRNFLCSKKGYCRLSDEYNPSEYRMAVYKSGLEVDPAQLRAGEFTITFECKPQRWLTSGETATTVANNGTMTNPTLFEAKPLLEVKGYGQISIAGQDINISNNSLGYITVANGFVFSVGNSNYSKRLRIDNYFSSGDTVSVSGIKWAFGLENQYGYPIEGVYNITGGTNTIVTYDGPTLEVSTTFYGNTFNVGTTKSMGNSMSFEVEADGGKRTTINAVITLQYDALVGTLQGYATTIYDTATSGYTRLDFDERRTYSVESVETVSGMSSKTTSGMDIYIDCDIGEAYVIINNTTVSNNKNVKLPLDLPVLSPGNNTITYPNTITQFKVTPRWWKV